MTDLFLRPLFTWRSAVASPFGPKNATTRHVLLTLSLHMNEKGESCFPSIELLVEESGLSRRAVIQHLQVANEDGWIGKRERPERSGQGWRRIEYFPLIPQGVDQKVKDWDEERRARRAPRTKDQQGGDAGAPRRGGAGQSKGGAPDDTKAVHDVHPSTSVSTSKRDGAAERRTRLPKDFGISDRARKWSAEKGYPDKLLPLHLEKFLRTVKANGSKYVDWDEAFMNCIADDWGEIRRKTFAAEGKREGTLAADWWKSAAGIRTLAKEHGVEEVALGEAPWETLMWMRARICVVLGDGPWLNDRDEHFQRMLTRARDQAQGQAA